jgi:hypothetical protein
MSPAAPPKIALTPQALDDDQRTLQRSIVEFAEAQLGHDLQRADQRRASAAMTGGSARMLACSASRSPPSTAASARPRPPPPPRWKGLATPAPTTA